MKITVNNTNVRRRLNANPAATLLMFNKMKEECFGFPPSVYALNQRLLGASLKAK